MKIGSFTYDKNSDSYFGEIATLCLRLQNVSVRPGDRRGARGPDYTITARDGDAEMHVGVAWKNTSGRGQAYLAVVLDDPALPARCNAALFLDERERSAELVWSRPSGRQSKPEPERPARNGGRRARGAEGPSR